MKTTELLAALERRFQEATSDYVPFSIQFTFRNATSICNWSMQVEADQVILQLANYFKKCVRCMRIRIPDNITFDLFALDLGAYSAKRLYKYMCTLSYC